MNQVIGVLSRAMDASALRQNAIANNVANVDTPNYKPARVTFEELLKKETGGGFVGKRTNEKHLVIGGGAGIPLPKLEQENIVFKNNGNGVDLDFEMTQLSQNTVWYQSLTYGLNEEFNLLKTAIRGGRG